MASATAKAAERIAPDEITPEENVTRVNSCGAKHYLLESIDPAASAVKPRDGLPRKFRNRWNPAGGVAITHCNAANYSMTAPLLPLLFGRGGHGEGMLDDIDRALLCVLQRDGQVSYAELGSNVGLSASALSSAKEIREIDTSVTGSG